MAIKFVDIDPVDAGKAEQSEKAGAPAVKREPDAEALNQSVEPDMSHPKPTPKKRGSK